MKKFGFATLIASGLTAAVLGFADPAQADIVTTPHSPITPSTTTTTPTPRTALWTGPSDGLHTDGRYAAPAASTAIDAAPWAAATSGFFSRSTSVATTASVVLASHEPELLTHVVIAVTIS
jgi:hypothetical protein